MPLGKPSKHLALNALTYTSTQIELNADLYVSYSITYEIHQFILCVV